MFFRLGAKMKNDLNPILVDEENSSELYYRVVGEDRKIHVSDLQTDFCKCGVKIIRKYVTEKDYTGINQLFSCYECTF